MLQIDFPIKGNLIPNSGGNIDPNTASLGEIIGGLLPYLFAGAGFLLLIYLIFGGLQLMTSRGDPKAVESAKGRITGALIGFIIVFAAYWLVQIVASILGLGKIQEIFQ